MQALHAKIKKGHVDYPNWLTAGEYINRLAFRKVSLTTHRMQTSHFKDVGD
jgi:hypothetical protein